MAQNKQNNRKVANLLKCTPMSKKEVHLLLDLISSKPILTSKNTKATVNKLKKRAWADIEDEFNAKNEQIRTREQLSLRWSNLKKTSRKKFKDCGGKLELSNKDGVTGRVLKLLHGSHPSLEVIDATYEVSDSGSFSDTTGISEQRYIGDIEGVKFKEKVMQLNMEMAKYYEKKAQKLDIEIKLMKLQLINEQGKRVGDVE